MQIFSRKRVVVAGIILTILAFVLGFVNGLHPKKTSDKKNSEGENLSPVFDTTKLIKTAEMLNEDIYWVIVQKSLVAQSQEDQEQYLISEIGKLTPTEMVGFRLRTDKLLYDTYNTEMWCAGYIINGGCSDDGFEYFRLWVISRGKDVYYNAKANPDNLAALVANRFNNYEFESFWYTALTAFERKTGKKLYDYIDYNKFKTHEGNYPQIKFTWTEDNPESMKKVCPQLFSLR